MGSEVRYMCLVETRRLLLLMGVVFGTILFVQYFELPYSNFLSTLFVPSKSQPLPVDNFPIMNSSSNPNLTHLGSLNSTDLNVPGEVSSSIEVADGKDSNTTDVEDGFDPEKNRTSDDTLDNDIDPEDELEMDRNTVVGNTSFHSETTRENVVELRESDYTSKTRVSQNHKGVGEVNLTSERTENEIANQETPPVSLVPSVGKDGKSTLQKNEKPKILKSTPAALKNGPSFTSISASKEGFKGSAPAVATISEMNDILRQSYASYSALEPQWSSRVDQELLKVQSLVENAPIIKNDPWFDVSLYRNFSAFKRSYELMEQTLKVYIYTEGERPIFHQPPLKGIYASEGWFMKQLKANKRFVTKNPRKAHLFYLPFSSRELEVSLYVPNSHSRKPLIKRLNNYIETIRTKHRFWNRTGGSDHFLVACHDWAPSETRETMPNCIRALCNSDIREGFQFGKDASLPETYVRFPQHPLRELGGKPPSQRRILAFFAGNMHGYVRPILLNHWENKDPDMKIFGRMRKAKRQMSYAQHMKSSKYCICAKGYEVNSPRVVEAIFYECVPVIISDNFVPPFFETLNWESFAVFVLEKDIPNLKNILVSISQKRYLRMQQRVKQVQQHFLWHSRPVKYDVFHMILHSVWYNRVFQTRP